MRLYALIISLVLGLSLQAQLVIKPINKSQQQKAGINQSSQRADPASLPFWDDFSIDTDSPDSIRVWSSDTTKQWNYDLSKDVFVNATLAINPPSYGVATFDGLDANGAFHGDDVGLTDQLVSDTIDLQGRSDVVFSFYWQAGGNVEIPEEGDSLVLQFYDPLDTIGSPWTTVWSMDGGGLAPNQDTIFTQNAQIVQSRFLTQKFVFQFKSYGDQDGPFDAWHVDWVYLNDRRAADDLFYEDISINAPVSLNFQPYKSIPFNQFSANERNPEVTTSSMNLNPEPDRVGPSTFYNLKISEVGQNQLVLDSAFNPDLRTFFNPDPLFTTLVNPLNFGDQELDLINNSDSVVIEAEVSMDTTDFKFLDGTDINLRVNDTVRTQYLLHNYYAYDDGTAEYAAGTNINGAKVAVQFWLAIPDTLTHVDIYFPNIDPTSSGSPLQLQIFKTLDDEPIRSEGINVENGSQINEFTRYKLRSPLVLSDTFFVGYQQTKNEYLGVGFDRSNPLASDYIFENKTGEWEKNTRLTGALMIRPVFESIDSLVLNTAILETLKVYPNPTNGVIQITGAYESVTLMDFAGKVWYRRDSQASHDFTNVRSGLYLLTIHRKEGNQTVKIIKK